jgi:hypothetical protein
MRCGKLPQAHQRPRPSDARRPFLSLVCKSLRKAGSWLLTCTHSSRRCRSISIMKPNICSRKVLGNHPSQESARYPSLIITLLLVLGFPPSGPAQHLSTLQIIALDNYVKPIPGVRINVWLEGRALSNATSHAQGLAHISCIPSGTSTR